MKIGDVAEILRFRDRREAAFEGEEPDGMEVWGEVKPANLDPLTGFVMSEKLGKVGVFRYPRHFALKERDILLCFHGVPARIGQVGMVVEPVKAIPASVMCIIRAHGMNPFALYPLLMQDPVRREFEKLATFTPKNGKAFLSLDHIRNYEVTALSYYLDYQDALAVSQMACEDMIELYKNNRKQMKEFLKRMTDQFYA